MPALLALLRFSLCAWVGAASLFVVTGIREVTSSEFNSVTKNHLAATRFPAYYCFGFVLVGLAVFSAVVLRCRFHSRTTGTAIVVLLGAAVLLMVADWFLVFQPLLNLMSLPDAREKPEFETFHEWSKYLNFASVGLCLAAALLSLREADLNQPATLTTDAGISA